MPLEARAFESRRLGNLDDQPDSVRPLLAPDLDVLEDVEIPQVVHRRLNVLHRQFDPRLQADGGENERLGHPTQLSFDLNVDDLLLRIRRRRPPERGEDE